MKKSILQSEKSKILGSRPMAAAIAAVLSAASMSAGVTTPMSAGAGAQAAPVASFSAEQCKINTFYCGFDSQSEFDAWTQSGPNGGWRINSNPYSYTVPAFSSINPESRSSLYFPRVTDRRDEALLSPEIAVEAGDMLSFWQCTSPIWLYDAHTNVYVVDNTGETLLLNTFLWSQNNPSDDTKWIKYEFPLDAFAGKRVRIKFLYTGADGEPVMIDDVAVSRSDLSESAKVIVSPGDVVSFVNLSQGEGLTCSWSFPGGLPSKSSAKAPKVQYSKPGVYDVTLEVKDASGATAKSVRTGFVTVQSKTLDAVIGQPDGVYYSPEAGIVVPLDHDLTFTDLTQGDVASRTWTFPGTDTPTSTDQVPTVRYTEAGMFDVDLVVGNSAGQSSTYIYGVRAGMPSLVWNIPASENTALAPVSLSSFGYYGGSNILDMPAFAELFHAPLEPVEISSVNCYFGACEVSAASKELPITVSVCKSENGLPGQVLASATMKCGELVDASVTFNDPTVFVLDNPATVEGEFFITIGDFPCNSGDRIALFCSPRREDLSNSTVYHLLEDYDENYKPLGTFTWVKNTDEALSFAIAPRIEFTNSDSSVDTPAGDLKAEGIDFSKPVEYFTISGLRLASRPSVPGVYLVRQGTKVEKYLMR